MRLYHLFIFLTVVFVHNITAQVDNSILINKNAEDIRSQIEALDPSNVDEIISLSNILYKTAFDNEDAVHMIEALKNLSMANLNGGNNDLAIAYLDSALAIANQYEVEKKTIVDLIKLKGNHYFDIEEYDKATSTYYESLEIAKEIDYRYALWALQTNLGFVKLRSGDPRSALEELKISDEILEKGEGEFAKHVPMLNKARICEAYIKLNLLDSALQYNDIGLSLTKKVKIDNIHIDLLMHRGIIYKNKKDYEKSLDYLNQAKKLCYSANDIIFLGKILNLIASCKLELKKYEESIDVLEESLEILTTKYSNSDELSNCYKLLGQSYKMNGDLEKSNEYYEKHILSLSKLNNKKSSASRKIREFTMNDYQSEIDSLENQKKKQKNRSIYSQIGMATFGLGLVLVLFFFIKAKKNNKNKFEALLAKIETQEANNQSSIAANENLEQKPIIDTKDKKLDLQSSELDISDELYEQILLGLKKIESQEYYLKTECNLYNVAKKINTNTSYLSKVINSHFSKNFNTYINDLRINYTILRLKKDSKFRSYSIKSIAEEVGYKSADSFSKYFKIHTGLLPSFYIKKLKSKS
ncbi:AraC family transcriptional regulator [Aquimarina sp. 2201CG14-23]|uniref:AraC family transcriptional regulator n=1 Tax=Aquimarina mycalae TaxID=3040073 RepID=UPI002477CF93|nr:AraC family transcriptional regulator [Aquimarina sp. 2201CG14-23]MDH7447433.1 AraC family transcriptional regulator [Aquimarina sp. 2201CG14-23]